MKKTFQFAHPKIKPERMVEAIKGEVSKYLKRERRKKLPEAMDFWDFDCRFGPEAQSAEVVHVAEIPKRIDAASAEGLSACHIEILAKPAKRTKKPVDEDAVTS